MDKNTYLEKQHLEQERLEACLKLMQDTVFGDDPLLLELVEPPLQEKIEPAARKGLAGHTLYIGFMRSEAYFCIYEKDYG